MNTSSIEIIRRGGCTWWVRDKTFSTFLLNLPLPFSVFLSQPHNQLIKKGRKKSLWEIRVNDSGEKVYLVKSYRHPKFLNQIKYFFRGSKVIHELKTAHEVARREIPTFLPAAAGEKKKFGLVGESYLATEKVEGCTDLAKYLLQEEKGRVNQERKNVIRKLGRLTRMIHDRGILQRDLALNNFLIKKLLSGESQLFFSDFEKVKLLKVMPESLRFKGLAKLNRIGREVSLVEKLRFLKAYFDPESQERKKLYKSARHLQLLTLKTLKSDAQRTRMTSVYTDCFYRGYRDREFHGYYRDGYKVGELITALQTWDKGVGNPIEIEVQFRGILNRVTVQCHENKSASKIWSNAFTLALGMLPVILPYAFFEKTGTSFEFIFFPPINRPLTLPEFLSRFEWKGVADLSRLLSKIHQFGTFSGKVSQNTFAFPVENSTVIPHIADLHSFSSQKEISTDDRESDLSSLISLLPSFQNRGKIEEMVKLYYFKRVRV